ncbi:DUF4232 domain-containing protein [Mycobacterium sp. MMS18-G62]
MNHIARQITTLTLLAGATIAGFAGPVAQADTPPPPCSSGQVQVSNGEEQAAAGHRRVLLVFSLAPDAAPCTLTGYPGVVSGAGGPSIQAKWTLRGYMGGVQTESPPTVTVSASQPAYAIVEGAAVGDSDRPCPTYTSLQVIPPDTVDAVTVAVGIDTCTLQVHPVNSKP